MLLRLARLALLAALGSVSAWRGDVSMSLFGGLFGKRRTASASHILVRGPEGPAFLAALKTELEAAKNLPAAFAEAAGKHSSCPSAKQGGSLGSFKQGAMVPAFDEVVFRDEVGRVHGPVKTPFGAHLIYIESRSDD